MLDRNEELDSRESLSQEWAKVAREWRRIRNAWIVFGVVVAVLCFAIPLLDWLT